MGMVDRSFQPNSTNGNYPVHMHIYAEENTKDSPLEKNLGSFLKKHTKYYSILDLTRYVAPSPIVGHLPFNITNLKLLLVSSRIFSTARQIVEVAFVSWKAVFSLKRKRYCCCQDCSNTCLLDSCYWCPTQHMSGLRAFRHDGKDKEGRTKKRWSTLNKPTSCVRLWRIIEKGFRALPTWEVWVASCHVGQERCSMLCAAVEHGICFPRVGGQKRKTLCGGEFSSQNTVHKELASQKRSHQTEGLWALLHPPRKHTARIPWSFGMVSDPLVSRQDHQDFGLQQVWLLVRYSN